MRTGKQIVAAAESTKDPHITITAAEMHNLVAEHIANRKATSGKSPAKADALRKAAAMRICGKQVVVGG